MSEKKPQTIYLKDYKRPDYKIVSVNFTFELSDHSTIVKNESKVIRTEDKLTTGKEPLVLNGELQKLLKVVINGEEIKANKYELTEEQLILRDLPKEFDLEITSEIDPANNKALEGLYKSGDLFCTQNEPEGMRRITYFIDRSDVMAKYQTKIIADKKACPIMLSNGNLIESGELPNGKHYATWEDPFPKPSYLFALVAGDLGMIQDSYKTKSGRNVDLRIYCDKGNEKRCLHAMESLKNSMKWDEDTFGLEYDLDIYMVVAVDSFNMGAMENKGLNIFNSVYVLADPETATDFDYQGIEGVIGHEYFHNWTGNRVTCRDWFQLTLKEGLTVFRDQEFSSDMGSRAVCRIQDVRKLRNMQFAEDAGPTSHPIRPESYIEINNFYTLTVYEKGSEVIRMVETIIGKENFKKGITKYFELYDGQAVTTEDFLHAMEIVSNIKLDDFKKWYRQAGTPKITVSRKYDAGSKTLSLNIKQECPETPDKLKKEPFHIPLKFGLIGANGEELSVDEKGNRETVLHLKKESDTFTFKNVSEKAIPSINRKFSAPIRVETDLTLSELTFLATYDTDTFNRWESLQKISFNVINKLIDDLDRGRELSLSSEYKEIFKTILADEKIDLSYKALCLDLPTITEITEEKVPFDYEKTLQVKEFVIKEIAKANQEKMLSLYKKLNDGKAYELSEAEIGKRSLKNTLLHYLVSLETNETRTILINQFKNANNMTDYQAAFAEICQLDFPEKAELIKTFYNRFKDNKLVMCKWLSAQATSKLPDTLERVKSLMKDPVFDMEIPNLIRALIAAFAKSNPINFHQKNGEGYKFVADMVIKIDAQNPQIAAGIVQSFNKWKKMRPDLRDLMEKELRRMMEKNLSKNVYEIVSKNLN